MHLFTKVQHFKFQSAISKTTSPMNRFKIVPVGWQSNFSKTANAKWTVEFDNNRANEWLSQKAQGRRGLCLGKKRLLVPISVRARIVGHQKWPMPRDGQSQHARKYDFSGDGDNFVFEIRFFISMFLWCGVSFYYYYCFAIWLKMIPSFSKFFIVYTLIAGRRTTDGRTAAATRVYEESVDETLGAILCADVCTNVWTAV